MADDLNKNITITVTAQTDTVQQNIVSLNKTINDLLLQQKQLDAVGQQNSATYNGIIAKLDALQKSLQDATTQLNAQTTAFDDLSKATKTSDTALGSLNTQLQNTQKAVGDSSSKTKDLTTQLNSLGQATKQQKSGIDSAAISISKHASGTAKSTSNSKNLSTQLNSLGQATKQQKGSIDSAASSISKHASSTAKSASSTKKLKGNVNQTATAFHGQVSKVNDSKKAFDGHKQTIDLLKTSFDQIKGISGEFGPSLQDVAQGFNAMKSGLAVVQGGLKGIGEAIEADGFGLLLKIVQYLITAFINSSTGTKMLQGALAAIGVVANEVTDFFQSLKNGIMDAFSHPLESIEHLGQIIEQNIVNRFKAFGTILDGIIHLDFKKIADGTIQATTGITNATDKLKKTFTTVKKGVTETGNKIGIAYTTGYNQANKAADASHKKIVGQLRTQTKDAEKLKKALSDAHKEKKSLNKSTHKSNKPGIQNSDTLVQAQQQEQNNNTQQQNNNQQQENNNTQQQNNNQQVSTPQSNNTNTSSNNDKPDPVSNVNIDSDSSQKSEDDAKKSFEKIAADAMSTLQNSLKQQADAKVAALEKDRTAELNNASLTTAQKLAVNAKYDKQEQAVKAKALKQGEALSIISSILSGAQEIASTQKTSDKVVKIKKTALQQIEDDAKNSAAKIAAQALTSVESGIKQQATAKVAALEQDKAAELNNTSLTSAQKLAINAKYKKQEDQVKAKAFKQEQELSIAQAVINGALAVTKVSSQSGLLAALSVGVVIAETAAEVAKIASQKPPAYAKGGLHYTSDGRGGMLPGYSRTDNTNAYLRSGEGIVVSEAMRDPWARNLVSAINVGFGGRDFSTSVTGKGFAVGGIFTDGGDANRYYNQPVTDNKNLANSIAYQMVNNFPPVYVDVKDINNQQNILAQTINRVNL
ncbi:hypothetical protein HDF19_21795 [Mucilaginibacter sp. E4BP6]|uniref:hypothetical protein n=1 Tax=Mucilaginibacter sp. E4BP6 TaxID=2723089 RepID=UPI0015C820D6|nr:hypothetical protein [Mucilaginibacter sp. E4BP6]NYE67975.1 myosin heavy subunit [Mucilaginibacter sp. E4BP6]